MLVERFKRLTYRYFPSFLMRRVFLPALLSESTLVSPGLSVVGLTSDWMLCFISLGMQRIRRYRFPCEYAGISSEISSQVSSSGP